MLHTGWCEKNRRTIIAYFKCIEVNTKIVATTIQKFLYIVDELKNLNNKSFAVIIDEAHSSTAGKNMQAVTQSLAFMVMNLKMRMTSSIKLKNLVSSQMFLCLHWQLHQNQQHWECLINLISMETMRLFTYIQWNKLLKKYSKISRNTREIFTLYH